MSMMNDNSDMNKLIDGAVSDEFSTAQKSTPGVLGGFGGFQQPSQQDAPKVDLSNPNGGLFQNLAQNF